MMSGSGASSLGITCTPWYLRFRGHGVQLGSISLVARVTASRCPGEHYRQRQICNEQNRSLPSSRARRFDSVLAQTGSRYGPLQV